MTFQQLTLASKPIHSEWCLESATRRLLLLLGCFFFNDKSRLTSFSLLAVLFSSFSFSSFFSCLLLLLFSAAFVSLWPCHNGANDGDEGRQKQRGGGGERQEEAEGT